MSSDARELPQIGDRFGYLLKHARERMAELSAEALRPYGVSGRELAVLTVLAAGAPPSQLEAAQRLTVDRTTMVALIDGLEAKGLVTRGPDQSDRRRNIVTLTASGRSALAAATRATNEAEAAFLAPLAPDDRDRFRRMLQAVVATDAGVETDKG